MQDLSEALLHIQDRFALCRHLGICVDNLSPQCAHCSIMATVALFQFQYGWSQQQVDEGREGTNPHTLRKPPNAHMPPSWSRFPLQAQTYPSAQPRAPLAPNTVANNLRPTLRQLQAGNLGDGKTHLFKNDQSLKRTDQRVAPLSLPSQPSRQPPPQMPPLRSVRARGSRRNDSIPAQTRYIAETTTPKECRPDQQLLSRITESQKATLVHFLQTSTADEIMCRCRNLGAPACRLIVSRRPYIHFDQVLRIFEATPNLGTRSLFEIWKSTFR